MKWFSLFRYLQQLLKQGDVMSKTYGKDLPHDVELSKEQQEQLERLRDEALNTKQ